jgi:TusA-related sulfurtransferase
MKEIKLDTKIADLLNNYNGMKDILISINPKFKKLNNPILRRTVAKVANIKQAAVVGGMKPIELLNKIRIEVGQEPIVLEDNQNVQVDSDIPKEIKNKSPKIIIDANKLLEQEKNPLAEANKSIKKLQKNDILLIVSDFKPEPLIDEFIKKGLQVYSVQINDKVFNTYIVKS